MFAHGIGTQQNPYIVTSAAELNSIRDDAYNMAAFYAQDRDIDISGFTNWVPIGTNARSFSGVYDGCNFKIKGLKITNTTGSDAAGLFGVVCSPASDIICNPILKRIMLVDVNINSQVTNTGALAGYATGTYIRTCSSTGFVTGTDTVGGLLGLTGAGAYAGLSGGLSQGGAHVSGFGDVKDSYSTCKVVGSFSVGGFVGHTQKAAISDCVAYGVAKGFRRVGGFVGSTLYTNWGGSYITNYDRCKAYGNISGVSQLGGFVGDAGSFVGHTCISFGNVYADTIPPYATYHLGGFVGYCDSGGDIVACASFSNVIGNGSSAVVGGFGGIMSEVVCTCCYSVGNISGYGANLHAAFVVDVTYAFIRAPVYCYYDNQTCTTNNGHEYATGKSTADMQTSETFMDWVNGTAIAYYVNRPTFMFNPFINKGYPVFNHVFKQVKGRCAAFVVLENNERRRLRGKESRAMSASKFEPLYRFTYVPGGGLIL